MGRNSHPDLSVEVANVVGSIISAFGIGMDLFRRMTGKKLKKRGREPTYSEEELWLRDSLDRRPREIRDSFSRRVARHGRRFEVGDSIAHTSLAHILLVLNSGLINLINQALSSDSKKNDLSRRSLLNLSEVAASDTLNALSQLSIRMNSQSQISLPVPAKQEKSREHASKSKSRPEDSSSKRRPGPAPLLARGGWVRPKSGSAVSSNSKSKRPSAKHGKSKSGSAVPRASRVSLPDAGKPTIGQSDHHRRPSAPDTTQYRRHPSMLLVPSDFFLPLSEEPESFDTPPPRPPKVPLHSRPSPSYRIRPPSQRTFMSASTKIGEIPEGRFNHEILDRVNESYDPRMVQYLTTLPDMAADEVTKKKGRGFKFWKKAEKTPIVAAY